MPNSLTSILREAMQKPLKDRLPHIYSSIRRAGYEMDAGCVDIHYDRYVSSRNPYGLEVLHPSRGEYWSRGYFAREPGTDLWINWNDLPEGSRSIIAERAADDASRDKALAETFGVSLLEMVHLTVPLQEDQRNLRLRAEAEDEDENWIECYLRNRITEPEKRFDESGDHTYPRHISKTCFNLDARFDDSQFDGVSSFEDAEVRGISCFDRAIFNNSISFEHLVSYGSLSLEAARFLSSSSFRQVECYGGFWAPRAEFKSSVDTSGLEIHGLTCLAGANVRGAAGVSEQFDLSSRATVHGRIKGSSSG